MANGTQPMRFGGKDPYGNIVFNSNVDWQDVNPRLLQAIQKIAAQRGYTVDVNSGYRSNAYSQKVGGFAGDPHSRGIAVDAYVGGKPIGDVIPANVWKALGVRSGDTFTYKGSTDPEHLDLVGMGAGPVGSSAAPTAAPTPQAGLAQALMTGNVAAPQANPMQNLIQMVMANNNALIQNSQPVGYRPF